MPYKLIFPKITFPPLLAHSLFVICVVQLSMTQESFADNSSKCDVMLRVLKGSEKSENLEGVNVKTGKYLKDVQLQLKSLPFKSYKVISDDSKSVGLGSKAAFLVQDTKGENHKLEIAPISIMNSNSSNSAPIKPSGNEQIVKSFVSQKESVSSALKSTTNDTSEKSPIFNSVMLDWSGPNNESLLSSKIHIQNGQDVLIGTDTDEELSTIFCLKIDCQE